MNQQLTDMALSDIRREIKNTNKLLDQVIFELKQIRSLAECSSGRQLHKGDIPDTIPSKGCIINGRYYTEDELRAQASR